jgi:hypothetical protein
MSNDIHMQFVFLVIIASISLIGASQAVSVTNVPDIEEILSSYEGSIANINSMMESCAFETKAEHKVLGIRGLIQTTDNIVFIRDKNRFDVTKDVLHFDEEDNVKDNVTAVKNIRFRQVMNGKESLYYHNANPQKPPPHVRLSITNAEETKKSYAILGEIRALDGYLPGDGGTSLAKILRGASSLRLRDTMEAVEGHEVHVMEAKTPHGDYTLWIDPEYGFMPRRITVCKTDNDLLDGKPVNTYLTGGSSPDDHLQRSTTTIDSIEIKKIVDIFLPVAGKITNTLTYSSGKKITFTSNHKRTNIDFNPDFQAINAFIMDVPNGTRVFHKLIPQIRFKWMNGSAVVDIDDVLLEAIDNVVQKIMSETRPKPVVTARKTEVPRDESPTIVDVQTDVVETQTDVPSGSSSLLVPVLMVIGLLIFAVIGWLALHWFKRRDHRGQ